jgi:hypothetical protein
MFGTIRKHQTWLWAVIITLTVISFVIYFSPYSKMNSGGGRSSDNLGSINGQKVTRQQYVNASREVNLHFFLTSTHWMDEDRKRSDIEIEREVYNWLLLTQKQEQLGVHVSDEAAAEMARQMIRPFERMGITSPKVFIEKVLPLHGMQVSDFERYLRHFVGIQELISAFGLSGRLVTPQEAKALYEREHQEVATEAISFNVSNYMASVAASPEAVSQFYSNRVATYMIPDRIQVSYVTFNVTNFLPGAEKALGTNINDLVESNLQRIGTNVATLFPEAKTPEEQKAKVREEILKQRALNDAAQKANEFAHSLMDNPTAKPPSFEDAAKASGYGVQTCAPFDRAEGPKDFEVGPDFIKAAFALTPEEPFAGPFTGKDGAYVIALNKKIPHEIPPLDQIRAQVETDYKRSQALQLARQAGNAFYQTLTNKMDQGIGFSNICAEAKITPLTLPPFSISTRELPEAENLASLNQLKQAAFSTPPGKASQFQSTTDGGMLLYVKAKLPLDQTKMDADFPRYLSGLRSSRQNEAFNDWLRREAEKGLRDTPLNRPTPPSVGPATAKS